ncbi:hypothetical protein AMECASPLE_035319 [Ameca splendens]|uniref:Uncharacterized protein n=1 Tax=Ameca splendens TaxID=208324 RepID=A0ABV0Y781_9TELE
MDSCGAEKIREKHQSLFPPAPTQRGSVFLFFAPQHHCSGPASLKTVENQMLKFTLHEEVRAGPEAPDVLQDTHDLSFWDLLEELKAAHNANISRRPDAAAIRTTARTSHQHNKFMSKIKFVVILALFEAYGFAASVVSIDRRN